MSHTTQCPSCQTRFRVTDAQLNVAGGLVRCGRCSHVFNAREALVEPPPPPPPPPPSPAVETEDDFELELPEFDPLGPGEPPVAEAPPKPTPLASFEPEHNLPEPTAEPAPAREQADELDAFQRALTEAMQPQPTTPLTPFEIEQGDPAVRRPKRSEMYDNPAQREEAGPTLATAPIRAIEPEAEPESEQPKKATRARIEIDWRRWARGALNGLFAVLGLLGIAVMIGQLAYYNRTRIAAEVPELRPALENACAKLGCTVPWPTDADLIRTEWSEMSFVPDHSNLIQLSATLKNHATYPQAFPIMELTLKDGEDQVLVRRSFTPAEYLKPDDKKLGRFNANSEVKVVVRLDVGKLKTMGYSLFWYYP